MLLRPSDWGVCNPTVQTRQFRYWDWAQNEGHASYHGTAQLIYAFDFTCTKK